MTAGDHAGKGGTTVFKVCRRGVYERRYGGEAKTLYVHVCIYGTGADIKPYLISPQCFFIVTSFQQ